MIIRVFHGDTVKDISIDNNGTFTIGSDPKDQLSISDASLMKHHLTISSDNGFCSIKAKGAVYRKSERIVNEPLLPSNIYVLGEDHKAYLVLASNDDAKTASIDISGYETITIGRNEKNTICVSSPFLSRSHAHIENNNGLLVLSDLDSLNGIYVNNNKTNRCTLNNGDTIVMGDITFLYYNNSLKIYHGVNDIKIKEAAVKKEVPKTSINEPTVFTRSPRLKAVVPQKAVNIESAPHIGGKPEINWLSTFLPMIVTIGIAIVMTVIGNSMMIIYTLPMTLAGAIVSVTNYLRQKKKYKEQMDLRSQKYSEHLDSCISEIEQAQKEQLNILNTNDPPTKECISIAAKQTRRLWERRPSDLDFVSVRIGSGDVDTAVEIKYPKSTISLEEDELEDRPQKIYEDHKVIHNAPIVCDIAFNQVCGIVGKREDTIRLLNNMLINLTAFHCYTEVKIIPVYSSEDSSDLGWLASLPHTMDNAKKNSFVAQTPLEVIRVTDLIGDVLKSRKMEVSSSNSYGDGPTFSPFYLFVLAEPSMLTKDNSINDLLLRNRDLGAGILFLCSSITQLPKECNLIIEINGEKGKQYDKNNSNIKQEFVLDSISKEDCTHFGQSLKYLYCEEENAKMSIPQNLPYYQMLGIEAISSYDIESAWRASNVEKSLIAPLGYTENNKLLSLDIHEKAHGPHGLVAGTTGSGKSEVLQSYIISLALNYHPHDVGFVLIDFKGGGMANQFRNLPHVLGFITDLDDAQIKRSLTSIEAELDKRKKLFAEAKVNHIDSYIQKYKSGLASVPLPHLIIIVDEFAELKAEQPDFMAALISTSRIGRSLGIHLILATQKPSGQVNDQIWSNSRFRICLKVATKEDSTEMLKSPAAFTIKNPGRAYLQVGNNEVFELFQSGYSGEKTYSPSGAIRTQLDETIEYIAEYCRRKNISQLPSICLAPLSNSIDLDSSKIVQDSLIPIGIYDDPSTQFQGVYYLDCFRKNTMIIGASQSGKTSLLQTITKEIALNYSPSEVSIYIIDFASMALKSLGDLPHVGGVVTSLQEEKLYNLFKLMNAEIQKRKEAFLKIGVSSFSAYQEAGHNDLSRLVLFVDNLAALREMYFQDEDLLLPICQYGLTYGISVVIANLHTSGLGYKYLSNFSNRIALNCADYGEYISLFDRCKLSISDNPGRCIVEKDKSLYECQVFLPFSGNKEIQRSNAIKDFIDECQKCYPDDHAIVIPEIPDTISVNELINSVKRPTQNGKIVIGLDYSDVTPFYLDLRSLGILAVSGGTRDECNEFIGQILSVAGVKKMSGFQFFIVDSIDRQLAKHKEDAIVKSYEFLPEKAKDLITKVNSICKERYSRLLTGETVDFSKEDLIVVLLNSNDAINEICSDSVVNNLYHELTSKYKNMNICILINNYENKSISYSAPDIIKDAKEARHFVFMDDIQKLKFMDIPYSEIKSHKKPIKSGDCFFIDDTEISRIKTTIR